MKKIGIFGLALGLFFLMGCTQQTPIVSQEPFQAKIDVDQNLLMVVADHADATSCWTIISGSIYDLTSWIDKHPGGDKSILASCGKDATEMFDNKHGMDPKKWEGLKQFKIMIK